MAYIIFDLDGTVICSKHRYRDRPDGSIDLRYWFDMATPENVAKDSLLPLAKSMKALFRNNTIIVCTARAMRPMDFQFLFDNQLNYHHILYRKGRFVSDDSPEFGDSYHGFIGDGRGDGEMKRALLEELFVSLGKNIHEEKVIMFDDNLTVIDEMLKMRIHCYDANKINERLAA